MTGISPVVAVIQARMSSSRLPGKVLMPIAEKPLLWHVVHRLRQCRSVDRIAIATSTDARDDAIEAFCATEGILCVRGSLDNVLDRYRLAAERSGARTLLRITGDSPLIDPGFVDYFIAGLAASGGDHVQLAPGALCAHEGVDVFSRHALDWLLTHAADDPVAREHVTSWFKLHPEAVRTAILPEYAPLAVKHARLSIDTADDLAFIRAVYQRLGAAAGEASLVKVLDLLRDEPHYAEINAHVRQKAMTQRERHALIVCEGGGQAGLGHLRRSLSLARALRDEQGCGVHFSAPTEVADMVRSAGFAVRPEVSPVELAKERPFDLAVVDVKDRLSRQDVAVLASRIATVAVIDDGSDRRLAATHAYYPPVPRARELSWAGSACKPQIGWEWCVLGFEPSRLERLPPSGRIVVSMGGADPLGLTDVVLEALRLLPEPVQADIVVGPAFGKREALISRIGAMGPNFHAQTGVSNLAPLFASSVVAVIAFGVTAYELAAVGVPALYIPISQDHVRSASAFADAGMGEVLSLGASPGEIARAVSGLLGNQPARHAMAAAGPRHIDGKGACRIAADLAATVAA